MGKQSKIEIILSAKDTGLSSGISKATKGLAIFQNQIRESVKEAKALDGGLAGMAGKFGALFGGVSTTAFAASIYDAGTTMDQLNKAFVTITGSAEAAKQELSLVRTTAEDLGLEFTTTANAYKLLAAASKGTVLEGKATRDIFVAISEASAALGMSTEETQGSLLAISQMISKGNVSAEELRGQLGERLPGAFQLAARAMGVTTQELDKLLQQGQVAAVDMLPKLATVLNNEFGKGAADGANGPVATLNRFKNAWFDLRSAVAESGFMDTATGKIKDMTAAMNDPKIKHTITELATKFFDLAEATLNFAVNHGEAIVKVTGGLVALSALSRTCALLSGIWKGLNAAMMFTTGLQLIPYLSQLRANLDMAKIATLGLSGALGAAAGSSLALFAGVDIGERIYKATEKAEGELRQLQHEVDITAAKFRQFAGFTPETRESLFAKSEKELESYRSKLEGAFKYQSAVVQSLYISSRETNFWGSQTEGAKKAEVELAAARVQLGALETAMSDYRQAAVQAHARAATSAQSSASTMKQATGEALDAMKKKYQEYANQIRNLQEQISGRERSLAAELRELSRTGMTDVSAWQDRKKEADQYAQAAKDAFATARAAASTGDTIAAGQLFKDALQYADDAKQAYKSLNTEVKSGDQVVISQREALQAAMDGVKAAGQSGIDILKEQQKLAREAMNTLVKDSGFANLEKGMDGAEQKWLENWRKMQDFATEQIETVRRRIDAMVDDRHVTVWVTEKVQRSTGGKMYHLSRGARLPGFGGGDKIDASLEAGEMVINKYATRAIGDRASYAWNNQQWGVVLEELVKKLGLNINNRIGYSLGGIAGTVPGSPSETINLNLTLPGSNLAVPMKIGREQARKLTKEVEKMHRMRS